MVKNKMKMKRMRREIYLLIQFLEEPKVRKEN